MKAVLFILLAATVVVAFSCKKSDQPSNMSPDYFIDASQNGTNWSGTPQAYHQGTDTVVITGSGNRQLLALRINFQGVGNYSLTGNQGSLLLMYGEAIIAGRYRIGTGSESTVNITAYDATNKTITGTFNVKLANAVTTDTTNPQNIVFTSGAFKVKLDN